MINFGNPSGVELEILVSVGVAATCVVSMGAGSSVLVNLGILVLVGALKHPAA